MVADSLRLGGAILKVEFLKKNVTFKLLILIICILYIYDSEKINILVFRLNVSLFRLFPFPTPFFTLSDLNHILSSRRHSCSLLPAATCHLDLHWLINLQSLLCYHPNCHVVEIYLSMFFTAMFSAKQLYAVCSAGRSTSTIPCFSSTLLSAQLIGPTQLLVSSVLP